MASRNYLSVRSFSSSFEPSWTYDLFLSFRGEDARKNFVDHLYAAFVQAGIYTFRDTESISRGEDISMELLKAIEESRISIVVMTKNYASSTWCLNELVKILECRNKFHQRVIPIFYDVDPSNVRKQRGSFAVAFWRHEERFKEEMEMVKMWRAALTEVASLSGWVLKNLADGYEAKFIRQIVRDIARILAHKYLYVAKRPVGVDSRVKHMTDLLDVSPNDVRIVGVYGMGGIGKTTMAAAVFNNLWDEFEGSCFLLNIKEASEQPNGLVMLQEQLLSDILGAKHFKINNVYRGMNVIKERLCQKKVLIVLDDLDQQKQLDALMGERNWFGPGSRIIITTRNKHLLTLVQVDKEYLADKLDHDESLELFCLHAFKESYPISDFVELSSRVVDYAGGLPLALEVLGSYLFKKSIPIWESAIDKLRKIPHRDIQRKLRISFDGLDDDEVKNIFLDIACFFIGMDKDYVAKILEGCDFSSEIGVDVLIQRSLVTIDHNELKMHDLLRDMGREIIREKSPYRLGERSRLWFHEDVLNVLKKQMGTEAVEGLMLDVQASKDVHVNTQSFSKMIYLRLLQINAVHLNGSCENLSKELRWLCWHKCPFQCLPPNFQPDNLAVLDVQFSNIREVWKDIKILNNLKILNLSHSVYLTRTPDFSGLSSLERLILEGCTSIVEVHQSIRHLERLVFLNLKGCEALKHIPESIYYLKSLQTLNISGCSKLEIFPEHNDNVETLTEPLADGIAIEQPPSPTGHLSTFKSKAVLPNSSAGLSSLTRLDISYIGLSGGAMPIDLGLLSSLQFLNLSGSKFFNLPTRISQLPKLSRLILDFCSNLLWISELPPSLKFLQAYKCTSMERLSIQPQDVSNMFLSGCEKLVEIQGLETVESEPIIYMENCNNLANNFKKSVLQVLSMGKLPDIVFPSSEIPHWFGHQRDGSSLSFYVPAVSDNEIQGLIIWVVYATSEEGTSSVSYSYNGCDGFDDNNAFIFITNKSNNVRPYSRSLLFHCSSSNHSWVSHIPFLKLPCSKEGGEELEVSVTIHDGFMVKKCGVHLIVNEPDVMNSQATTMPYTSPSSYENSDAPRVEILAEVFGKRDCDDDEAEPSRGFWSNEERFTKRLKMEPDA